MWSKATEWRATGDDFCIVARHSTVEPVGDDHRGPNRWAVYAYIYPTHWHYAAFAGDAMWQDAATALPMHCGPSLLTWHYTADGKATSVQVGADYNHLHDQDYTHMDADDSGAVLHDAKRLFDWLAAHPAPEGNENA